METPWNVDSLKPLLEYIWNALLQAEQGPLHPWHLPALVTTSQQGPDARTVVLRAVTRPGFELMAFSDRRAAKVAELERHPRAVWLFYDPQQRVQLRAYSEVRLHSGDAVSDTYWHRVPPASRRNYLTLEAPGTPVSSLHSEWVQDSAGLDRFTVIVGRVYRLDWLWLAPHGHRRAGFTREGDRWHGSWLVP